MEKTPTQLSVCPVCSLFLREGISLKDHLQTHSKEKVIEALLKQDPLSTENVANNAYTSSSPNSDSTALSVAENRVFTSVNRSTVSILPSSSSFTQSSNNHVTQTTQSLTYDSRQSTVHGVGGVQYPSVINNNVISQPNFINPCGTVLTYHQFLTNDGNIILIPTYNVPPAPVLLPNNVVNTPLVNSCVVVPPTNPVQSVNVVGSTLQDANKFPSTTIQNTDCIAQRTEVRGPPLSNERESTFSALNVRYESAISVNSDETDEEKENDEEVASIFEIKSQNHACEDDVQTIESLKCSADDASYQSEPEDDKSSCASVNYTSTVENETCTPPLAMFPPRNFPSTDDVEAMKNAVCSPAVSVIRVRSDLNYEGDGSNFHADDARTDGTPINHVKDEECRMNSSAYDFNERRFSPAASTSHQYDADLTQSAAFENVDKPSASFGNLTPKLPSKEDQFDFANSNSDNAMRILPDNPDESAGQVSKHEKEHYILPNDIPRTSPVTTSAEYNFTGLRNSFLTSASLISSVNKTMFADVDVYNMEKNKTNFFDKYEDGLRCTSSKTEEQLQSVYSKLSSFVKLNETDDKELENVDSSGNSRASPFNIQTDELMPARGELSGQESLSGTENSVWELQVQQNAHRFSATCLSDNAETKIGLHSLITEINIKKDLESSQPNEGVVEQECTTVVREVFRKKIIREFRCFFCKERFDTWKLRQSHIADEHAYEDGLTVESLFGKKIKCKIENNVKTEQMADEGGDVEPEETFAENILCRICSVSFQTNILFLKHLRTVHSITKRSCICPTCFVQFCTAEKYQEHIQKVHPYECMTCGKQFFTRPGYMLHQKRHMKIKPYSCDVCDKSFVTKQKLTEHFNIHTGENPIKCDLCDSDFKRYSNYQQHKKYLHLNQKRKLKDYICDCGDVFHSKLKLIWHREIHDAKPKQCPFCVERFVHTSSLTRHVRKWHNETYLSEWVNKNKTKNVTCPVCNISYLHTSLQTHMRIHEGVKPYSCSECSKTFRTKWNLQLHRWTHMSRSAKPFKCKLCVKAYIHKTDYDAHVRSHNNCRPYSCNVCGRQFIRKYNCIRHMREHKEPRSYKCDVCGKLFSRSYYLTEHEKVHTGEKPHVCHICGKSSATKSNHNKHVRMHNVVRESVNSEV